MVSKARLDFPEPDTPVTTVMALWGISKLIFFRLWTRAPETAMEVGSSVISGLSSFSGTRSCTAGNFSGNLNKKLYVAGAGAANGSAEVLTHEQISRPPQADSE